MTDKVDWSSFEVVDTPASSVDWESFEVVSSGKEKPSAWRRAGDIGISAVKSAIGVPEAAVGLADIVTGGKAGKMAEWAGFKPREAKAFLDEYLSPQQKEANKAVSDAEGFVDTAAAAIRNPSVIGHTALESLGAMGAGGLVGRGVAGAAKIAPWLAGAIGEGVVGAGSAAEQIRQQSADGELSLGQSAAAVGSGIGTAAFGAAGGRIAQKLGVADIDTVLAAGGKGMSSKGIAARIIGGGLSEGVFEELPQSVQEQIFQNAALDKPLMDGVPESAAMGLVTGAAMGGVAGGAISGKVNQQTAEDEAPAAAPTDPLLLTNSSTQNLIAFPDGSVGTQADVDSFINGLPEGDRIAARARLLNLGEQEVKPTIEDIAAAPTVDDAIATAQAVVAAPPEIDIEIKNQQIDQAFSEHMAGIRQQQFDLAEQARRDADAAAMQQQMADQQVEQANALTQAQGFDAQQPTAMELAMVAAQQRRELLTTPVSQRAAIVDPAPAVQAAEPLQQEAINEPVPTPSAAAPVLNDGVGSADIPATQQPSETQGLAPVQAPAEIRGGDVAAQTVPAMRTSVPSADGAVGEFAALSEVAAPVAEKATEVAPVTKAQTEIVAQAKTVLNAAQVSGKDRLDLIDRVRSGSLSLEDLSEAFPSKTDQAATNMDSDQSTVAVAPQSTSENQASIQASSDQSDTSKVAQSVEFEEPSQPPKDSNSTLKSTAPVASGLTAEAVTKSLTRVRAKWLGFSKVNTVQSVADLPADIAKRANADDKTEAIYDPQTKSVHLIADNIKSPERAVWTAVHEVVGHGGLRMLKDKSVNQALNIAGLNRFVRDLSQAIGKERGDTNNQVEEAVAELAAAIETDDFQALADRYGVTVPEASRNGLRGTIARVLDAVKRFLSVVMGKPVADVSDADVRDLIGQQRKAVEGKQQAERETGGDAVMASTRAEQTKTPAFQKWFGESKVVDENGEPLVVYHGTIKDFGAFDVSADRRTRGGREGAYYFSPNPVVGSAYAGTAEGRSWVEEKQSYEAVSYGISDGGNVISAYLSLQNPLIFMANGRHYSEIENEAFGKAKAGGHDGIIFKDMSDSPGAQGSTRAYIEDAYVAFDPAQVKSAISNNGDFDPDSANILQSRAPTPTTEHIPKWAENFTPEQKEALRKSGAIYTEQTLRQRITEMKTGAMKKLQYGILDQFAPIKDQLGKIPYVMARMAKNADGTLEALMLYGRPHLDADGGMLVDTTKKGFIETMQALNGEHDRFFSWLAGRRAAQLKTEGRENLFTNDDISSLSTLNHGKMADGSSRETAYLKAQKDIAELNKSVLDIAEKSGIIDPVSRKVWASDFYVPFYRVMEEGVTGPSIKSGLVNQKTVKKLKGGTNNLGDLTQNMLMNWSTLLTASAKNRAADAALTKAASIGAATEADEATIRQMGKAASTKAVSFMDGGANRWFVVEDEHLLAAISALEFNGYNNGAMKVMSAFKNYLTLAVTSMPLFKVRNLIRDSVSSIAVSDSGYNPFANVKQGFKLMRDDDFRAQMIAGGGSFRFGTLMEGQRGKHVKNLIDAGVQDGTILDTKAKMKAFMQKLWDGYQNVGDLGENVNRAALYKKLRDEGKTHLEASFEARDLMDFGLSGAWAGVRALNQVLPFFNARLQGIYKLGRGYNDDPKRMGYVVGAVALASVALMLAYKDDDDWKKRTDSDRNNYWWFKVGDTAYRLPKPFEIGAAGSAIEHFTALFLDSENTDAKRFRSQMGELVNGQLAMNPIPQLFRPMVDVYANKDGFTGRPIESMAMEKLRPEDRYTYNTSELARMMSKSGLFVDPVSLVSGAGVKQLSPVQIDSMIRGYFSGMGSLATASTDALLHHTVIDRGESLPLTVKDFAGSFAESLPSNSSRYVDMLYSSAKEIEQTYGSYRNAIKSGDIEKARAIQEDEGEDLAKYHLVEALKKNEAKLTQQIQRVMNSKDYTGEQKEVLIRSLRAAQDRIARRFEAKAR